MEGSVQVNEQALKTWPGLETRGGGTFTLCMKVWILEKYGDPDPTAFATEELGLKFYYDYIEERTSGMPHDSPEFEWHEGSYNDYKHYSCYCYGEFVARLTEVEVQNG